MTITPRNWVPMTPQKWVPITPITPLFERAIDLYNTHHSKILEEYLKSHENCRKIARKSRIFLKIEQNLGKNGKVDFNEGEGCAI